MTGAAGFVGTHLCAHLEGEGDDVVGVDRESGPDLLDPEGWTELVGAVAPEAIYHLGGWSDVGASWSAPLEALRTNGEGTLNVLDAARGTGARVLVVSSADVYGKVSEGDLPLGEGSPFRPVTPYAASKVAADQLALQAWLGYGTETIRVRAFNHLGPGQSEHFVGPALAGRIARNELDGNDVVRVGATEPRRDITDVRDVVRAYRSLVVHGAPGEAYNVCSGRAVSVGELAGELISLATKPMKLEPDPELTRPVEVPMLVGDPSKLSAATGWEPSIALSTTLADVLAEWRERARSDDDVRSQKGRP